MTAGDFPFAGDLAVGLMDAANHLTRSEIQVGLRVIEEVSREYRRPQISKRVGQLPVALQRVTTRMLSG